MKWETSPRYTNVETNQSIYVQKNEEYLVSTTTAQRENKGHESDREARRLHRENSKYREKQLSGVQPSQVWNCFRFNCLMFHGKCTTTEITLKLTTDNSNNN